MSARTTRGRNLADLERVTKSKGFDRTARAAVREAASGEGRCGTVGVDGARVVEEARFGGLTVVIGRLVWASIRRPDRGTKASQMGGADPV
jgi:hypothetical protein